MINDPVTSNVPEAEGSALSSGCAPRLASVLTHELTQRSSDVSHSVCDARPSKTPDICCTPVVTSCCMSDIQLACPTSMLSSCIHLGLELGNSFVSSTIWHGRGTGHSDARYVPWDDSARGRIRICWGVASLFSLNPSNSVMKSATYPLES